MDAEDTDGLGFDNASGAVITKSRRTAMRRTAGAGLNAPLLDEDAAEHVLKVSNARKSLKFSDIDARRFYDQPRIHPGVSFLTREAATALTDSLAGRAPTLFNDNTVQERFALEPIARDILGRQPAPDFEFFAKPAATAAVTVIVPSYNAERTLDNALASLRAQTFKSWTAVVVDDGSSDRSLACALAWSRKDHRIRVLQQTNQGVSSARNLGIAAADTEWLLFLDADDALHPQALKRLMAAAKTSQAEVVLGRSARVDANGARWRFPQFDLSDPFAVLSGQCALVIHSAIVRRNLVNEVGAFDVTLRTSEDWDLWQRLARSGARFHQIDPIVAFYQSNAGSLSKRVRQLVRDTLEVIDRGHRPDARVPNPMPAYANGASPDPAPFLQLNFILWSAAREIAEGGQGVDLLDLAPQALSAAGDIEPEHLGAMMVSGMADFLQVQPTDLAARWADFAPRIGRLLDTLYSQTDNRRQRDLALLTIKTQLGVAFDDAAGGETAVLGQTRLNLEGPSFRIDARDEGVAVQLLRRGRPVGFAAAPALKALSNADVRRLALRQFPSFAMTYAAPALKPWRRLSFWLTAAGALARGWGLTAAALYQPGRVMELGKHRLRHAFVRGAQAALADDLELGVQGAGLTSRARRIEELAMRSPHAHLPQVSNGLDPAWRNNMLRASRELTAKVPVLMYHQIADDGPAALARWRVSPKAFALQMAYLREQGFWAVKPEQLAEAINNNRALPGRPVLITFDDAYVDFQTAAWPILKANGLSATLFVVTDKAGGVSDWDAQAGTPAPLLDWPALRQLASEGVSIGSHAQTHRRITHLSMHEAYDEVFGSRARLADEVGTAVSAFCYPFGARDRLVEHVVGDSGFELAFCCEPAMASLSDNPLRLPRIEISGADDLVTFSRKIGRPIS